MNLLGPSGRLETGLRTSSGRQDGRHPSDLANFYRNIPSLRCAGPFD